MENVVVAIFDVESEGYQAITELKQAPAGADAILSQAVLIQKEYGRIVTKDEYDTGVQTQDDTIKGGLLGAFVGILGGPLGVLLGGNIGLLVGMGMDTADAMDNVSMIEQIAGKIPEGSTAIIGLVQEETPAYVDQQLSKFQTKMMRFDAAVVAQEIETARELEKQLQKEAREKLRQQKKDEFKQKVEEHRSRIQAQFEELKAKVKK